MCCVQISNLQPGYFGLATKNPADVSDVEIGMMLSLYRALEMGLHDISLDGVAVENAKRITSRATMLFRL